MRVGELCNLDLRDLHLESGPNPDVDVDSRVQIESRPDSLFVSSEPSRNVVVNGEERTASNKRKRDTTIPVDDEASSGRSSSGSRYDLTRVRRQNPVYEYANRLGKRLTPDMVHHTVETHARERGWYRDGGGAAENVTPTTSDTFSRHTSATAPATEVS